MHTNFTFGLIFRITDVERLLGELSKTKFVVQKSVGKLKYHWAVNIVAATQYTWSQ